MILTKESLKASVASYVASAKISVASFSATYNNTVGLLDVVAKIFTIPSDYVDKLEFFDGEDLSYGKNIEEWKSDLKLMEDYDATGANALSKHPVTYRPVSFSYTLGRKKVPVTIPNNDVERCVHNAEQLAEIVADKYKVMTDSEKVYKYAMKRQALGVLIARCIAEMDTSSMSAFNKASNYTINSLVKDSATPANPYIVFRPYTANDATDLADAIAKGYLVKLDLVTAIAKPIDATTGEAFIEQIKADVEIAEDNSWGHSLNGNALGATKGLKLILLQGVKPNIEVNTQAGAFQAEKVAFPSDPAVIPDFGDDNSNTYAVLMDARGVKLHNTYRAVRENLNGDGDWLNLFFHVEYTCHVSRNTFVKVYKPS